MAKESVVEKSSGEGQQILPVPQDRLWKFQIWACLVMLWSAAFNGLVMLDYIHKVSLLPLTPVPVNRYGLQAQYWSCLLALMVSIMLAMNLRKYTGRKRVFVALSVVGALITLGALAVVIVMQLDGSIEVHRN